ncbi:CDK5 regulatory subunit-associated protein 2-like [Microtus ochrogaster]|uniref:CDK5 regulatory subunit-associated protein 2-like n=1 Tax=Microtus ochrogaster TaxID=79684 RepID=A0ABM1AKN2_MICOH|nr:CDK5 regulatory subunit-associated protein 2-like [Microtus ochrogaster]
MVLCSSLCLYVTEAPGGSTGHTGLYTSFGIISFQSEELPLSFPLEQQITELKKENFNLKLRIYFLEERMQQEFAGPTEHIYKTNIELKVEVESLKQKLQERDQLLISASIYKPVLYL